MSWGLWISLGFNALQLAAIVFIVYRCLGGPGRKITRNKILRDALSAEEEVTKGLRARVKELEAENARLSDLTRWIGE